MRVLLWHVHGSWTTSFVQGEHTYLLPATPDRGPDGRGRAATWDWPPNAIELPPELLRHESVDVVVLQRRRDLELVERWLARRPGRDIPAVYVEHNTPGGEAPRTVHPMAGQDRVPVVHVTHFNRLFWDNGSAPTTVIEHGIPDPGHRYVGDVPRAAVVVNDPLRRGRAVGTDLLGALAQSVPVDVFGMNVDGLPEALDVVPANLRTFDDYPQHELHAAMARCRVYVHLSRWTSLGLSLIEAMQMGMPAVALAATEVAIAIPPTAGMVTTRWEELVAATHLLVRDPVRARATGTAAREAALTRYGLDRFLAEWDSVLARVVA